MSATPNALDEPSLTVGKAMSTTPPVPMASPAIWPRGGNDRTITAATNAAKIGVAPFSIPVTLLDTCCSANGNTVSGAASQTITVRVTGDLATEQDETLQVVLANLRSPLGQVLMAAATGRLAEVPRLAWQSGYAVTVVIAAEGYPAAPRTGDIIEGLADAAEQVNVDVFHAGTTVTDDGEVASAGGRVLSVTAHGETLARAREHAYAAVDLIRLEGSHHRRDIARVAAEAAEG